ncbi:MAG: tetratricopeptide repeat protein [Syntrophales bacterium]|nr:tetratricopeptide repeat protein [Syntrophales bacterium]MDD5232575.1 tetratricopeptide repeat protein [Syntrophales bacterium]MDD5532556.1 tetratricopeptide repeat protein [Syntrophales bacterium]HPL64510.1 tetratricopeptide repeat protein [Syntrophales bacterium]
MISKRFLVFGLILTVLGAVSCTLPRIITLEDRLTPEEHLNLGAAYERKGKLDDAIREYETAAKRLPRANLHLGNAWFGKGDYGRAEKYYRKALEEKAPPADAYNNLAWLLYVKGQDLAEAETLAAKAVRMEPRKEYRDTLDKIRAARSEK